MGSMVPGQAGASWRQLKPFLPRRGRLQMATVSISSFLGGIAESGVLVVLTLTADSLIRQQDQIEVAGITMARREAVFLALGLVVLKVIMTIAAAAVSARFASDVMRRAQSSLLRAYLFSSHAVRSGRPPGDLNAVMVNHGRFTGDLANGFCMIAASVCGLLAFGGTSLAVNPVATLGIMALGLVVLALMRPLRSSSRAAAADFAESAREMGSQVTEVESLHREIELFQVQDPVRERVEVGIDESAAKMERLRFLAIGVPQLFQAALLAAAVVSLLLIVDNVDDANLASVGAVVLLLIRSMSSAQQFVVASQKVIEQAAYATGLNQLIAQFHDGTPPKGTERPSHLTPVRLEDLSFSYSSAEPVLRDLDFEIDQGELVGVVGPSGAGKSTLVELLLRLRSPGSGLVSFGGVPAGLVDDEEFARRVAFVPQQPVLIAGTIAENVDLFRGLSEAQIRSAIKAAHIESEVEALPEGIHTRLGPDDRALSGGQRQRLTIARALAGDPEILILDEPTSALDAISEHAIRQTLTELPSGRLVIVVAHRYSTLRSCSRILALRDGHLEADATPEEVARRSTFFRTMVDAGA